MKYTKSQVVEKTVHTIEPAALIFIRVRSIMVWKSDVNNAENSKTMNYNDHDKIEWAIKTYKKLNNI